MADTKKGKKRSKAYYVQGRSSSSKKMRRDKFLDVGMRGFLLTCNRMEQLCVREGYTILGEYADKLYGPEKMGDDNSSSENESESESEDIEASLRKEVAQMKQKKARKEMRFEAINSGAKNVIFIRTKLPDPTELVHHLLTDIATTQTSKSRHIMRMLPINMTCRATVEDIAKHAPEFLQPYFHSEGLGPETFAIKIKIRNCGTVKRDDVIKLLAGIVTEKGIQHKVDLDNPALSVIVEIVKNVCCMSVVRDFDKLKRYNLQEIIGLGESASTKTLPGRVTSKDIRHKADDLALAPETKETGQHQEDIPAESLGDNPSTEEELTTDKSEEGISKSEKDRTVPQSKEGIQATLEQSDRAVSSSNGTR